jgi:long-chain fatty acid transport protein
MSTNQQRPTVCRPHACLALLVGAGVLASDPADAGGILGYEIGTADVGLASAGWGARARDASTLFTNVAGMTRLDGDHLRCVACSRGPF